MKNNKNPLEDDKSQLWNDEEPKNDDTQARDKDSVEDISKPMAESTAAG